MLEIRYKCKCMPVEAVLYVRYRKPDEDVVAWMQEVVTRAIGDDHHERSPLCQRETMEYAKVPASENAPYIGGKPVPN